MRLTGIILLAGFLQVSAHGSAQTVTYQGEAVPLTRVLSVLEKQTGYVFFYNSRDLEGTVPVTVNLKNAPLEEALKAILYGQFLKFVIKGNTILITRPQALQSVDSLPPKSAVDLHGRVSDSAGAPLSGASVSLKGTRYNTSTDNKGNFSFPSVPQGKYTLMVSYIGYAKTESNIIIDGKPFNVTIVLHTASSALDQIQVIAYGTESKRFSVGSVTTVSADVIEKQPVTNPLLALQGQVPGLAINSTSGVPGSQVLVQVRGQNTLVPNTSLPKGYDQPLFIIDGVPFAPQNNVVSQLYSLANALPSSGGISQGGGISPFNNINPNDIESISVLKDADATSIYGTQGSNGVIIITTKKGKPGKTAFDLNVNSSFNSDARPVQLLNTEQYLQYREDAYAADGVTPTNDPNNFLGYAPDLTIFDQDKYTNWQKVINGKTSNNTDIHASLSGGNANTTFIVSPGYSRSDYNFPGNFADQRMTLHSALHSNSVDKRFTIDLVTDYAYDQNNSVGFGAGQDILLPPNLPDLLDPAGNLVWTYKGADLSAYQFYGYLKEPTDLQNYNLNLSLNLSYKILEGLTIGANLGYSRNTSSENSKDPASAQNPLTADANASFATNTYQTINIEPQLNYTKSIGKGSLTALLGSTYKKNTNNSTNNSGYGYTNDNLLGSILGAATVYDADSSTIYRYSGAFARLKYIYDQKYIIEATGNRDGSSNFGPGLQFGNFGSVGAGWIFSEEKTVKDALPFLSYGKLSGSYGTTGSDGIQGYQYQAFSSFPAFQGIRQSYPYNLYNPDYSWATKKSLNVALDFGFFNNRLLLNATYYRDREGNQLVGYELPVQTGFTTVLGNLNADIQNKGYEFSATSTNIKTKDFTWTTNFNLTFNRNKLLAFPNLATSSYAQQYVIGQPTSIIFGYRYKDVNPTTGLFEFYDRNGKVTSNPISLTAAQGGDEVPIANREVNFMGGFGNNFRYKHFNLYIFCQFSRQNAPNYLSEAYSFNSLGLMANKPTAVLNNYWKTPGDNVQLQRLASGFFSPAFATGLDFDQSSGVYGNDTYLRVKTVALSYALPDVFLKKIHIQGASIYLNAQNLLTITNYKVGDPEEPGNFTVFPVQRIIAFGLNLHF
jgi:TonB-dependent starch-binding outer membrane protein SusC